MSNIPDFEDWTGDDVLTVDGVRFEVVAKVRAVKGNGDYIDALVGPVVLERTPSLYKAVVTLATACNVPEYQISPDAILDISQKVVAEIEDDAYAWTKRKKK